MTSAETLQRIAHVLARLAAGEQPNARDLAGAPLAKSWSIVTGEETFRIRAVTAMPPDIHARPRVVPLLAIDSATGWALVLVDDRIAWWVLGSPLPNSEAAREPGEVLRRATAWTSRLGAGCC